jgi:Phosphoribulokinase / Uridine kinase family
MLAFDFIVTNNNNNANSDLAEHRDDCEIIEALENGSTTYSNDSGCDAASNGGGGGNFREDLCPASPTTVPIHPHIHHHQLLKSPKQRRQRTTSVNANTIGQNEAIIRSNNRTIYTAGRPPWYNRTGQQVEPFVIGICGGSASGKTTVAQKIIESLDVPWVTLLSMDCFYKVSGRGIARTFWLSYQLAQKTWKKQLNRS